jgi:ATP-dependent DNA ligase
LFEEDNKAGKLDETLARLRSRSCIIDGEAVACDDNGVASFDLVGERTKAAIAEQQKFSSLLKMLCARLT